MSSSRKSAGRNGGSQKFAEQVVSLRSVVRSAKDTVSADLDGEAAILNLKNGVYYSLNPVGARIWTLIQKTTILTAVHDTILDEYDIEADVCERDMLDLVQRLAAAGLVEIQSEGTHENSEAGEQTV